MDPMQMAKRFAVTIVGVALLAVGAALMVLPGPGILLIVAGLAVLASEYAWARRLLGGAKKQAQRVQQESVKSPVRTAMTFVFAAGLVGTGVAMFLVDDVTWPVLDSLLDSVWGRVTGTILVLTGLLLVATTYLTLRTATRQQAAHPGPAAPTRAGATRTEVQ